MPSMAILGITYTHLLPLGLQLGSPPHAHYPDDIYLYDPCPDYHYHHHTTTLHHLFFTSPI